MLLIVAKLEAQEAALNELYKKAFKESGGLLHRRELVKRADKAEAELTNIKTLARAVVGIHELNSVHPCQAMDALAAALETDDE